MPVSVPEGLTGLVLVQLPCASFRENEDSLVVKVNCGSAWLGPGTPAQWAGETLFLGVSLRVFLEGISIWISRLSKDGLKLGWHHPIHWGSRQEKKRTEEGSSVRFLSWNIHRVLPFDIRASTSGPRVLSHPLSQFPSSWMARCWCSVAKSCLIHWDPMDSSTPGLPVPY